MFQMSVKLYFTKIGRKQCVASGVIQMELHAKHSYSRSFCSELLDSRSFIYQLQSSSHTQSEICQNVSCPQVGNAFR